MCSVWKFVVSHVQVSSRSDCLNVISSANGVCSTTLAGGSQGLGSIRLDAGAFGDVAVGVHTQESAYVKPSKMEGLTLRG
jgi:hypothetical protein